MSRGRHPAYRSLAHTPRPPVPPTARTEPGRGEIQRPVAHHREGLPPRPDIRTPCPRPRLRERDRRSATPLTPGVPFSSVRRSFGSVTSRGLRLSSLPSLTPSPRVQPVLRGPFASHTRLVEIWQQKWPPTGGRPTQKFVSTLSSAS